MSKENIIIKKYANRRLYNTSTSEYITLEDLCDIVKKGIGFQVVDAKSAKDLTRTVLTQIIFEQESKGYNLLPISFLRNIISMYDDKLSSVLPTYLEGIMETFKQNQDNIRKYMDKSGDISKIPEFDDITKRNMEIFNNAMSMFNPFSNK